MQTRLSANQRARTILVIYKFKWAACLQPEIPTGVHLFPDINGGRLQET